MIYSVNFASSVVNIQKRLYPETGPVVFFISCFTFQGHVAYERKVLVDLTKKGKKMREKAAAMPQKLVSGLLSEAISIDDLNDLKNKPNSLVKFLLVKSHTESPVCS